MRHPLQAQVLLTLAALGALACRATPDQATAAKAAREANAIRPVRPEWVTIYDPQRASNGYTLTLHESRIPVLLDMNGRPVHGWPRARIKSRVRLLPDGSILGIGLGRQVVEYDWDGNKTWEFATPDAIPHHDVLRLANGNTLVLLLRNGEGDDTLLEVDRAGKVVWSWRAAEHLGALLPKKPAHPSDLTHINSLQELPENPWYTAGDRRFRPGSLLLSARNLNLVFVVERPSGDVVWWFNQGLDRQHEAHMNATGEPRQGHIQIFNNRPAAFRSDRQSEILEIAPSTDKVVWRYKAPGFFSPTSGLQQALPNGNILITSTRGGRVFEIDHQGELAWEWAPPYEPVRALRVAKNACPQLAALAPQPERAVTPAEGYRFVDPDAYRFARRGARQNVLIDGQPHTVLAGDGGCGEVLLPLAARLDVAYGVDRTREPKTDLPSPVFTVRVEKLGSESNRGSAAPVELLNDQIGAGSEAWRKRSLSLEGYALQTVRLCVEVSSPPGAAERFAFWEQPQIATGNQAEHVEDPALDDLTVEERAVRLEHLKSLGYIN
ncbi:MAG: arylsulfotransferase family protein [Acidobacteriota bacterium]